MAIDNNKVLRQYNVKEYSGLLIDRPNKLPFGDYYFAEDTSQLYKYDYEGNPIAIGTALIGADTIYNSDGSISGVNRIVTLVDTGDAGVSLEFVAVGGGSVESSVELLSDEVLVKSNFSGQITLESIDTANNSNFNTSAGVQITDTEASLIHEVGDGVGGTSSLSSIKVDANGIAVTDSTTLSGMKYSADYSANFTDRSLVDKAYVDAITVGTVWGNVTGLLSDQVDLQSALDSKFNDSNTTTDLAEGSNLYYTETRVTNNSAVVLNTAKVSYTDQAAVALNTAKTGITAQQSADISTNNSKISYTDAGAVAINSSKVGITAQQASDITSNNAKISYTDQSAVAANTAKISFDNTSSTRLANTSGTNTGDQDLSGKQDNISLTTTGTSGVATFDGTTLNIPEYSVGGGGDLNFVYDKPIAAATWNINHNLGKFPSVTVVNTSGDEVVGTVQHIDVNNITITFSASFAGKAYLN